MSPRCGILALAAIVASCSATPPAPAPPPPSAAATEVPPPAPTPSASAAAAVAAKPPPDTRVRDACTKLCERVNTSCAEGRGDACLARCASYEAKSAGCEAVTVAAFTCQLNAPEGFCHSVVAPRCVDAFAGMMRCHRGEAPVQESAPKAQELPAGWERVSDTTWGLAFPLPKGAALDSAAKSRTWRATAEGASYEVIELPMPAGKLDDRAFIKLVIAHVGVACQREMKLGGRVDDATHTFIRFETGCTGKERLYGKIYVGQKHAISMLVRGEQNSERREVFLESVQ